MKLHYGSHRWSRYQDMRAAADWQLEQVIKWLEDERDNDPNCMHRYLLLDLKKAMRPQEES